jgi:AmmeMemoRadiSam system protein B
MAMKREMSVAGTFYPADKKEIEKYLEYFNKIYNKHFTLADEKSQIVIVPHAGYVYSGFTANVAYRVLQNSGVKRFVVIGPSHRVAFEGISLCDYEAYVTPFGAIPADLKRVEELQQRFGISCLAQAHHEHSTEVQFPLLKHYIPDASLVELVYSQIDPLKVAEIIEYLLEDTETGLIVSTDLSHFYPLSQANTHDSICLQAIEKLDTVKLHQGCEACGIIGVEALMISAQKLSLKPHILDYRTSADASEDTTSVVGYVSAYFR